MTPEPRAGPPNRPFERTGELRARHVVLGVLAALAVVAALVLGIGKVAGFTELREAFADTDVRWLGVCVAGQVAVFTGYAGALRSAVGADGGAALPGGPALRLVLASFAATQLFAFGGLGGLALIFWALRRLGLDRVRAAERLIGLNTAVYLTFGGIAWVAAWWALAVADAPLGLTVPWLALVPAIVALARWFTAPERVARFDHSADGGWRLAVGVGVGAAAWVRGRLVARDRALFDWSAGYWIGDIASLWAALHAVGARPGMPALVLAYATGYLAQSLPIPFIATGGVDAATTFLLHMLGVPLELALAGVVVHRVFAFWLPVVPGAAFALTLPRLGRSLAGGVGQTVATTNASPVAGRSPSARPAK